MEDTLKSNMLQNLRNIYILIVTVRKKVKYYEESLNFQKVNR